MHHQIKYQIRYALPVWFILTILSWLPDNKISIRIRGALVSLFLPGRPSGFKLGRDVTLLGIDKLNLGSNVYMAKGCWINALGQVNINSDVMLAPYVVIASTRHTFKDGSVSKGKSEFKKVDIGSGTWIAAHSTVIAGVSVGSSSIVAANSVVVKSFGPRNIVSGVPAKTIGENNNGA